MSDIELHANEQILAVVRRAVYRELPRLCFSAFILLLPFFFFFPLMQLGGFGFVIFIATLAFACLYAAKVWVVWFYSVLIVTDGRVIDAQQQGLFVREISQVSLEDIEHVELERKGLIQSIFQLSTAHIRTKQEHDFDIRVLDIKYGDRLQLLIDALHDAKKTFSKSGSKGTINKMETKKHE